MVCRGIVYHVCVNALIDTYLFKNEQSNFEKTLYTIKSGYEGIYADRHFINVHLLFLSMKKNIILASGSPRRKMLLEWAEVEFTVITADTEEIVQPELTPEQVAIDIANVKANAVKQKLEIEHLDSIIIAADTIVVLDNQIIGKPQSKDHAIDILRSLSGQQHRVITGVVMTNDSHTESFFEETVVRFHPLTLEQITFYIDKYQPYDKAGAYAIQEWIGVIGIESISGDFYNVMGLPVSSVVQRLTAIFQYK